MQKSLVLLFICFSSTLLFVSCGSTCKSDRDCEKGFHCKSGACVLDCRIHSDCPEKYTCSSRGKCIQNDDQTPREVPPEKPPVDGKPSTDNKPSNDCQTNQTRECYSGNQGDIGKGPCKKGKQSCVDGKWGACIGEVLPQQEVCDDRDNDCDGQVDEEIRGCGCKNDNDCLPSRPSCRAGLCFKLCTSNQECKASDVCTDGSCQPCPGGGARDKTEECNGKDDDCDGQTDEGLSRSCGSDTGECKKGTQLCKSGTWSSCDGEIKATTEVCDRKDNDCDGQTDEGLNCSTTCKLDTDCKSGERCCVSEGTCYPTTNQEGAICAPCKNPCGKNSGGTQMDCVPGTCGRKPYQCRARCNLGSTNKGADPCKAATASSPGEYCSRSEVTKTNSTLGSCIQGDLCDPLKATTCPAGAKPPYNNCCPQGTMCFPADKDANVCMTLGKMYERQKGCKDVENYTTCVAGDQICGPGLICAGVKQPFDCKRVCKCNSSVSMGICNSNDCKSNETCAALHIQGKVALKYGACINLASP